MFALPFGLFGLIVGSFLNVLILRYPERGVGGRSACMSCGKQIRWYDNIPVFSWLVLRGRCRDCHAHISIQYPLVEALTAILFALIGASTLALPAQIAACIITALLIAIAVYDFRHTVIPDPWVYTFALVALFSQLLFGPHPDALTFLSGAIVAAPLFALWLYSRGAWMGFGDVKLAVGMGWLLGAVYGVAALFLAFVVGAFVGVGLIAFTHTSAAAKAGQGFTMKSEIPFGPFLVASTFIVWLLLIYQLDPLLWIGLSPL
jgi:leader peptidase (prepilin peptidase)/N-methyltransferase